MPHINRIRVNNVKYNFGTQYYDDFVLRFSGKNTIYDLANGGGKSVLMLLLLQNLIPNCTLDEKQPIEKLFRSGNGNTTIHSMIEWKLNPCHIKNGMQYMTTGFCARKARGGAGEDGEDTNDKASVDYFNYCIFYRQFNDNDLKNLPLSNGKERITYLGLRSYLQELEKKDFHVEVKIFDRKGDYQRFISNYGLFESEWEIIRGINKTEGHVRTYFETNYRTTRKVVEDLLIEEIIEKSFYHKTGMNREDDEMADTLLALKDQLVLLSKKKNELHYYDQQKELIMQFSEKVGSLQGMYEKKYGLEEQLVKTYHTTLKRREQKEQAHARLEEEAEEILQQKHETSKRIALADICRKEQYLGQLQEETEKKELELSEASEALLKKRSRMEERECDNYYLNYLEYEKEYMAAQKTVEEILSGSQSMGEDLSAMANELRDHLTERQKLLAETVEELQQQICLKENEKAQKQQEENRLLVQAEVLKRDGKHLETVRKELQNKIRTISAEENLLIFIDPESESRTREERCENLLEEKRKTAGQMEQIRKELYSGDIQIRMLKKEEQRIAGELERLSEAIGGMKMLRQRIERLISVYGGTPEALENILFQRQKELVLEQQKYEEEKKYLQEKLQAVHDGLPVPEPKDAAVYLEDISRYYDEKAVSGYEYLRKKESSQKEFLLERYPMLPYAVVTSADLQAIAEDVHLRKTCREGLVPVISLNALEREQELVNEQTMIFAGQTADGEKIKERLFALEELFAAQYEQERVLKKDYDFVRTYFQECQICGEQQQAYDLLEQQRKQIQTELKEQEIKSRKFREEEAEKLKEQQMLEENLVQEKHRLEELKQLMVLEQQAVVLEEKLQHNKEAIRETEKSYRELCRKTKDLEGQLIKLYDSMEGRRQELAEISGNFEVFQGYANEQDYRASGMEFRELMAAFTGKRTAYEQKNTDVADKRKLSDSYKKAMARQKEQLQLLGYSLEELAKKAESQSCVRTGMEQMLVLKEQVFAEQNRQLLLENERRELTEKLHRMMGNIQYARQSAEEKYGNQDCPEIPRDHPELYIQRQKKQYQLLEQKEIGGQRKLRDLEEQCYALKAMAQDMERMMKSAGIVPDNTADCLDTGISLKEQYEGLRTEYEKIVREEMKHLEEFSKEKRLLAEALQKIGAYELSCEIEKNMTVPENEAQIQEEISSLKSVAGCLELEKERIGRDMDSLQELKDRFEAQCLQNCLNIREELEKLQKLSKIVMDGKLISMITLQIPYIREELYENAMSDYIDRIVAQVEKIDSQAERLNFIRNRLAFKNLFSVIVNNMDAIRLTLYKRERMKEQSRYLKYEEAVGSTGQSQGIYIQFLVAIINYISSINSPNADPLELKKVIFIDNPFGAAKDIYIWEPIFKLLKANNVQLIVPARGATPAITGHFEVNYILGQKLIDGRQQTVVIDYRSQTKESEMEYSVLEYEQETLNIF